MWPVSSVRSVKKVLYQFEYFGETSFKCYKAISPLFASPLFVDHKQFGPAVSTEVRELLQSIALSLCYLRAGVGSGVNPQAVTYSPYLYIARPGINQDIPAIQLQTEIWNLYIFPPLSLNKPIVQISQETLFPYGLTISGQRAYTKFWLTRRHFFRTVCMIFTGFFCYRKPAYHS